MRALAWCLGKTCMTPTNSVGRSCEYSRPRLWADEPGNTTLFIFQPQVDLISQTGRLLAVKMRKNNVLLISFWQVEENRSFLLLVFLKHISISSWLACVIKSQPIKWKVNVTLFKTLINFEKISAVRKIHFLANYLKLYRRNLYICKKKKTNYVQANVT